jgi:3-oxoadipate enol-lactonase
MPRVAVNGVRCTTRRRALGAAPAAVCGLSMGGNIALNLTLAHPGTVTKLILCDTGAGSEDAAAFKTRCEEYAQAAEKSVESFFQAVMSTWPSSPTSAARARASAPCCATW